MALASLNVPQKVDTPLRLSLSVSLAGAARPGASRLFLLCVGIAMPHSCPPPPWSVPLLLLRAVGRQSLLRHGPAAALSLFLSLSLSSQRLYMPSGASKNAARSWGPTALAQGLVSRGRRPPWAAGGGRRMRSWMRGGQRRVRQVALCSGSHRLFYAEPVTQGGWKARQMTDTDIQLPG